MEALIPVAIILAGVALVVLGLLVGAGRRVGIGPTPGELRVQRGPVSCVAPLGVSLLVSVLLTLALNAGLCGVPR